MNEFSRQFEALTGKKPFPWQCALYDRFVSNRADHIPRTCTLPTGLGKTSVIAIWLLALIEKPDRMPRRLVYVVNRRTVVDQTTTEVVRLQDKLRDAGLWDILAARCAVEPTEDDPPLAISTLRGQYADNQRWSADPSRPAVICGTVDMIGSRLLFGGYRIGFKSRPLHAGFLGQDALLVHDEAHLEPAFQKLIETIQKEQAKEREHNGDLPWPVLRVMALSATVRVDAQKAEPEDRKSFGLTDEENQPPDAIPDPPTEPIHHVWRRLKATKSLHLHAIDDEKKLAENVGERALTHKDSNTAVLIFVRTIDDVNKVCRRLADKKTGVTGDHVAQLTGTMRGYERDQLVKSNQVFVRFMPAGDRPKDITPAEGTVYLVCTSAGEVGVNLSADHMVCDLSTLDSMIQRLGRVNRFGEPKDHVAQVDVVHPNPEAFDDKHPLTPARKATLALLQYLQQNLDGDLSPKALNDLKQRTDLPCKIEDAFAPEPTILPATDILFDGWALTSIRQPMPGRPPVEPYLHGIAEWQPPETHVAWREEVEIISEDLHDRYPPADLLDNYPLLPHELLRDRSDRVFKHLETLAKRHADRPVSVWIVDDREAIEVTTLAKLADKRQKDRINSCTLLLPPSAGGLAGGMLDSDSPLADDVADKDKVQRRQRFFSDDLHPDGPQGMALVRTIDTAPDADERENAEIDADTEKPGDAAESASSKQDRYWHWYTRPRDAEDATRASTRPIKWDHHTCDVVDRATTIVETLNLPDDLKKAILLAAELHDLGKQRELWQRSIGNPNPTDWYAKPGKPVQGRRWRPRHITDYRHEFGSLLDALDPEQPHRARLDDMPAHRRDLVLHLVAAHHGYARPHFPPERVMDPNHPSAEADTAAVEAVRRYARLQRRYGRWGLAYLESLLRAADWAASAQPARTEASDTPQEARA